MYCILCNMIWFSVYWSVGGSSTYSLSICHFKGTPITDLVPNKVLVGFCWYCTSFSNSDILRILRWSSVSSNLLIIPPTSVNILFLELFPLNHCTENISRWPFFKYSNRIPTNNYETRNYH